MAKKKKGLFIVFDGLDGSGTTTQAKLLAEYLKKKGYKVELTTEPSNNIIGGLIRGVLTGEWKLGQVGLQLLFSADRAHHLEKVILPAIRDGKVIISTRYFFSTIAFGSLDLDPKWLYEINKNFRPPDLTFYLRVSPKECLRRIAKARIRKEFFEKEKKLAKVQKEYNLMGKSFPNFYVIDGERSVEDIFEDIKKIISRKLK